MIKKSRTMNKNTRWSQKPEKYLKIMIQLNQFPHWMKKLEKNYQKMYQFQGWFNTTVVVTLSLFHELKVVDVNK